MGKKYTISFAGDTSFGEYDMKSNGKKQLLERLHNHPSSFIEGVKPLVKDSDYFILNLETALDDNPVPVLEKNYLKCDSPEIAINLLKELNVSAVSLNNNHVMDFGEDGYYATTKALNDAKIPFYGAGDNILEAEKPYTMTLEGEKSKLTIHILSGMRAGKRYREYGFFATENSPGVASANGKRIRSQIAEIRKKDPKALIIITPHWQGIDYKYAEDNPKIVQLCRSFIDAGANYVIAHGPHMLNGIEKYKDGEIAYSIGNFVFNTGGQYQIKQDVNPFSVISNIQFEENGESWDHKIEHVPILIDNKKTKYRTTAVLHEDKEQLRKTVEGKLNSRANLPKDQNVLFLEILKKEKPKQKTTHSVTFAGDTTFGEYFLKRNKKEELKRLEEEPTSFIKDVMPIFKESDYNIINLETVLAENPKRIFADKKYPNWDLPSRTLRVLGELKVTAAGIANNHIMDFGEEVMLETKEHLNKNKIGTIGAGMTESEANAPYKITLNGLKSNKNVYVFAGMKASRKYHEEFRFFAGNTSAGVASIDSEEILESIKEIRVDDPEATIVIFPHWQGVDYKWAAENPEIKRICRRLIDSGADFIVGHGPHGLNEIEEYEGGVICYSIGNLFFASPGRYDKYDVPSYSFIQQLQFVEEVEGWTTKLIFYPINTNNKETKYQVKSISFDHAKKTVSRIENERHGNVELVVNKIKGRPAIFLADKKMEISNKSTFLHQEIIKRDNSFDKIRNYKSDEVAKFISELCELSETVDENMKLIYENLNRNNVVNKNENKVISKLAAFSKKRHIPHPLLRKFEKHRADLKEVISFSDIMTEKSVERRKGVPEYSWKLDKKHIAYQFVDNIGVRRPFFDEKIYALTEIPRISKPTVIKPIRATGSMGVYLIFSDDKILSAREGKELSGWNEMMNDLYTKMKKDQKGQNRYFKRDEWMIEELILEDEENLIPASDLKFYSFYGTIAFVLESNRFIANNKFCFWDTNGNKIDTGKYKNQMYKEAKGFNEGDLKIVSEISKKIPSPFIRIDMLKSNKGIVFGEATPRPGRYDEFNKHYDRLLGEEYRKAEGRILKDLLNGKEFNEFQNACGMKGGARHGRK